MCPLNQKEPVNIDTVITTGSFRTLRKSHLKAVSLPLAVPDGRLVIVMPNGTTTNTTMIEKLLLGGGADELQQFVRELRNSGGIEDVTVEIPKLALQVRLV